MAREKRNAARPKTGALYKFKCANAMGYVETSPSCVLRDGEGRFAIKTRCSRRRKKIAARNGAVYI
jgi:hypothetical protein